MVAAGTANGVRVAGSALADRRRIALILSASAALIAGLAMLNLSRGAPNVGVGFVVSALTGAAADDGHASFLIRELRLPRILLATSCGCALGLAGVLLQDALRNPLADPGLLGVAQGASFAVALTLVFPSLVPSWSLPILCLVAGGAAGLVVLYAARTTRDPVRLILAGAMISILFGTLTSAVLLLAPWERTSGLTGYFRFVIGSASTADWGDVRLVLPWLALGVPAALLSGRALNLLQLGDDIASGVGMNPQRTRLILVGVALVLVSPVVAATGPVSFVALFAPHVARGLLQTSDARPVLVVSAVLGALMLLAADTVGRLLFFPTEVPAGIWTIVVIGPVAIFMAARTTRATR